MSTTSVMALKEHESTSSPQSPAGSLVGASADLEKGEPTAAGTISSRAAGAFDPRDNPDGGRQAWLCVLGAFCCLFCSFGWISCIGVFQDYYQAHQLSHMSPSTVAWIPSLETFCMFFWGPAIGKLYDNFGPRWLLLAGTFFHVFGLMMTSLSTQYYQFLLAQGVCSAIGASMIFYPALSTIPTWFFKKRGAAFGIMVAGSSLGGVIIPIMANKLIPKVGFGWSVRIIAFLILFLMIVANLTVKSRVPPFKKPLNVFEFVAPLRELPYDLVAFGSFLFFLGLFVPINYLPLEARSHGMAESLVAYLIPILNGASLFGRTVPGFLADKIGRFNMTAIMCYLSGIITLALWLPATGPAAIVVFAAIYGFASGGFFSLMPSIIAQISDVRQIGVRTGTLFAIVSIAALISNPIGGVIISRWDGKYTGLAIYAGILLLAGSSVLLAARFTQSGGKLIAKV